MKWFFGLALPAVVLLAFVALLTRISTDASTVRIAAAASLRPALEDLVAEYRSESGHSVAVQYGGSEELLTQIRTTTGRGFDLYLPADESYVTSLKPVALHSLGSMRAVVLFQPSSPIASWAELTAPGRRLALAEPSSAAIGKLTEARLEASGRWPELAARIVVHTDTVTHSGNAVKLGTVEAAIVWDAVASGQFPDLPQVALPELEGIRAEVVAARLNTGDDAESFWRFLTTDDRGRAIFRRRGFAEPSR